MSVGMSFVSEIIVSKDWRPVVDNEIGLELFENLEKKVFRFLERHKAKFGTVPDLETVQKNFPGFELINVGKEPVEYWIEQLRFRKQKNILSNMLVNCAESLKEDNIENASKIAEKSVSSLYIVSRKTKDIDLRKNVESRFKSYLDLKVTKGIDIPTGIEFLDESVLGFHREEVISLYGKPKVGKTWLMCLIASKLRELGLRVLMISMEMPSRILARRIDSISAGISYEKITEGALDEEEWNRLKISMESFRDKELFVITQIEDQVSLTAVIQKVEQYRPEILLIDGAYLIAETGWESVSEVSRGLHLLVARKFRVPVIASWQFQRGVQGSGSLDEVGLAYAISQDSDVVFSIWHTEEMNEEKVQGIKFLKIRERSDRRNYTIRWDLDNPNTLGEIESREERSEFLPL